MNRQFLFRTLMAAVLFSVVAFDGISHAEENSTTTTPPATGSTTEQPKPTRKDFLQRGYTQNYRETYQSRNYAKDYRENYRNNPVHTSSSDSATRRFYQNSNPNNPGDYQISPYGYSSNPRLYHSPGQVQRNRDAYGRRPASSPNETAATPSEPGTEDAAAGTGTEAAPEPQVQAPVRQPYRPMFNPALMRSLQNRRRAAAAPAVSGSTASVSVNPPMEQPAKLQTPSEQLFSQGMEALEGRRYSIALRHLNDLAALSPADEKVQLAYGFALFYNGEYPQAVEALQKSTALANEHLASTDEMEEQLAQMEPYRFHRRKLERFVENNPNDVDASSLLLLLPAVPEREPVAGQVRVTAPASGIVNPPSAPLQAAPARVPSGTAEAPTPN